jgi:hypothetical protein
MFAEEDLIEVLGYDGQKIGTASNFVEAKEMHLRDIREHRPEMVEYYAGISTQSDSAGMPIFHATL